MSHLLLMTCLSSFTRINGHITTNAVSYMLFVDFENNNIEL
jgi:hypothetical protein